MGKSFRSTFSVLSHCYAHICESRKNVENHTEKEKIFLQIRSFAYLKRDEKKEKISYFGKNRIYGVSKEQKAFAIHNFRSEQLLIQQSFSFFLTSKWLLDCN